ncbi:MAG TPA: class I SAM-dependent methyltransferase [Burkholderiales bacterium]|nr:class I SAM-dependent methyltransferase [Burkholderiales bacterium]
MDLAEEKRLIEEKYGPWTAHNMRLPGGLYTRDPGSAGGWRARRILQLASDLAGLPFASMRVLDLACLEGLFGAEFAARGAEVVGIEIREANIVKARFVKRALGLDRLTLLQEDVRQVSHERHGAFDVILCLGILYHLEADHAAKLLRELRRMTRRMLIVDTHIALQAEKSVNIDGREYWGSVYREHDPDSTPDVRARVLWASADNDTSFWFTRDSLVDLLREAGYPAVLECHSPEVKKKRADRVTVVAMAGEAVAPKLAATDNP